MSVATFLSQWIRRDNFPAPGPAKQHEFSVPAPIFARSGFVLMEKGDVADLPSEGFAASDKPAFFQYAFRKMAASCP
jgi:hypothetical protein